MSDDKKGLKRIYKAFFYSIDGYKACFKTEAAFRQEVFASLLIIPLAFLLSSTGVELALMIGSWGLVMVVEIINSAVERAIDRISEERHELSKEAKDMGSAAVLACIFLCAIVWACILLPKIF